MYAYSIYFFFFKNIFYLLFHLTQSRHFFFGAFVFVGDDVFSLSAFWCHCVTFGIYFIEFDIHTNSIGWVAAAWRETARRGLTIHVKCVRFVNRRRRKTSNECQNENCSSASIDRMACVCCLLRQINALKPSDSDVRAMSVAAVQLAFVTVRTCQHCTCRLALRTRDSTHSTEIIHSQSQREPEKRADSGIKFASVLFLRNGIYLIRVERARRLVSPYACICLLLLF